VLARLLPSDLGVSGLGLPNSQYPSDRHDVAAGAIFVFKTLDAAPFVPFPPHAHPNLSLNTLNTLPSSVPSIPCKFLKFHSPQLASIAIMPPKKSAAPTIAVKPNALKGKSVIVTGEIDGYSRKAAEEILVNAGAVIEKSLNKKVQLVVLGADAGPKKIEKIEQLGIESKDWADVIEDIKADGAAPAAADEDEEEDEEVEEDEEEEEEEVRWAHRATARC
jgi:hypothetical protein